MNYAAVDFESYYDDECSITTVGTHGYMEHPKFDPYLVSIVTSTGLKFVGDPKEFDWASISGADWTWLHHNASFDGAVLDWMRDKKMIPDVHPFETNDTADLAAYLGSPRSLKVASEILLQLTVSKDTRNMMKGQVWANMTKEFQEEVKTYALSDSELCLQLWNKFSARWPEHERRLSRMTRDMGWRGLPIDLELLDKGISSLELQLWAAQRNIPWLSESSEETALSPKALARHCRSIGILPPTSMAKDSPELEAWAEKYGAEHKFVQAVSDYRRINALLQKFKTVKVRVRPDGTMPYALKYFGATTGRWSGDSGVNVQNIMSKEIFGVNLRLCIQAPKGYTFAVVDLSNIEPRVGAVCCKDTELLKSLREGGDIYEAAARRVFGYSDPRPLKAVDPGLRKLAKIAVLGLGYSTGHVKFIQIAKQAGVTLSVVESKRVVDQFRAKNPKLTSTWRMLEQAMRMCNGKTFEVELPSGRMMRYQGVTTMGGPSAVVPRLGKMMRVNLHGGLLYENLCQATARDVFSNCLTKAEDAGLNVVLHCHDEIVALCKNEDANQTLKTLIEIMSTPPEWMPSLPIAAEGGLTERYVK